MTVDRVEILRAVGPRLSHVTARANLPGIRAHGLQSAAIVADHCGYDPGDIVLRSKRRVLTRPDGNTARLNHQLPILHGRRAADSIVDSYDAHSWAKQLDKRIFFWPERRGEAFGRSVARDADMATLYFDTARLLALMADHLWLSPFNTGNFRQGGARARRGDWIYCSVTDGLPAFRSNRQRRGLIKGTDTVAEISLTTPILPEMLDGLLTGVT